MTPSDPATGPAPASSSTNRHAAIAAIVSLAALQLADPAELGEIARVVFTVATAVIALAAAIAILALFSRAKARGGASGIETGVFVLCILGLGAAGLARGLDDPAPVSPQPSAGFRVPVDRTPIKVEPHKASQGEPKAAIDPLDQLMDEGMRAARTEFYDEALMKYREALELAQKNDDAEKRLAATVGVVESLLNTGQTKPALETADKAVKQTRASSDAVPGDLIRLLLLHGIAQYRGKQSDQALTTLTQALELTDEHHPDDLVMRQMVVSALADVHFSVDDTDKALVVLNEQITKLESDPKKYWNPLASLLDRVGQLTGGSQRWQDSITAFEAAIEVREGAGASPVDTALIQANLAISLWRAGDRDKANDVMARALKTVEEKLPAGHQARQKIVSLAEKMNRRGSAGPMD